MDLPFLNPVVDAAGRTVPQAIAHRGYRSKFPENSMAAFKGAVAAGADAVETDLHLTKDGVIVLSHVRRKLV
jgi:glycerophosphoryl diester phosphodiesterase